jgi:hypothetical protein
MPPRQVTGVKRKEPAPCEDDDDAEEGQKIGLCEALCGADPRLVALVLRPICSIVISSSTQFVDKVTRDGALMFVQTGRVPLMDARPRRLDVLGFVLREATRASTSGSNRSCPNSVWPPVIAEFAVLLSLWHQQCWPLSTPDIAGTCSFRRVYKALSKELASVLSASAQYLLVCACMELGLDMTGHIQDTTAPLILCGPPWDRGYLERHVQLLRMIDEPTWHADTDAITISATCRCTVLHAYVDSLIAHEILLHPDVQNYVFPADGSGGWSLDRRCKQHRRTPMQTARATARKNSLFSLQYKTLRTVMAGRPLRAAQHREDVAAHLLTLPPLCNDVVSVCIAYLTFL